MDTEQIMESQPQVILETLILLFLYFLKNKFNFLNKFVVFYRFQKILMQNMVSQKM